MDRIYECTRTKSVLNILGPFAEQVICLKESQKLKCDATTVCQLSKLCEALQSSCSHLLSQLSRYAEQNCDQVFSKVVKEASLEFSYIIRRLTDSTKDLQQGDIEKIKMQNIWSQLELDIESLFENLVKILLAWDHSHLCKINSALDTLQFSVESLKEQNPVEKLSLSFKEMINNAVDVFNLVMERCEDICSKQQKQKLHILCLQIHALFPLLSSVVINCTVHPNRKLLRINQNCVVAKMLNIISDLRLQTGMGSPSYELQIPALFINTIDSLFDSIKSLQVSNNIKGDNPVSSFVVVLKAPVELVLKYAIGLAQSCTKSDHSSILAACENVLHQIKILSDYERSKKPDKVDIDVALDVLSDVLEVLELRINTSLIRLIVQALADPFSSLDELLRLLKNNEDWNISKETQEAKITSFIKIFEDDLDTFCQIGNFTIACTADENRARKIESSLATLEWLESILIPAVMTASKDPNPDLHFNISALGKQWVAEIVNLRNIIDLSMDPAAFSLVTKQEIHEIWAKLREALPNCEQDWLKDQIHRVACLTRRILTLDRASLFLYNSFREEIKAALKELKKYEELISINDLSEDQKKSLIKRVQLILTVVSNLSESLNQEHLLRSEYEELIYGEELQEKLPPVKLSDTQRKILQTSLIEDIPVDVASLTIFDKDHVQRVSDHKMDIEVKCTPIVENSASNLVTDNMKKIGLTPQVTLEERPLTLTRRTPKRSNGSLEILNGISIDKGIKRQLFHDSFVNDVNDSKNQNCDTSIDITKFLLSRSANNFRNSTRASKRNFSLKVKEINIDIGDLLDPKPNTRKEVGPSCVIYKNVNAFENSDEVSVDDLADILKHLETLADCSRQFTDDQTTEVRTEKKTDRFHSSFHSYETCFPERNSYEKITTFSKECASSSTNDFDHCLSDDKISQSESKVHKEIGQLETETTSSTNDEMKSKVSFNAKNAGVNSVDLLILNSKNDGCSQSPECSIKTETDGFSSLNISTPQRLGDLKVVHKRLAALKAMFR